jgi:geranylgeranyl pyrophosphate synthase/predicted secreted hydrolase
MFNAENSVTPARPVVNFPADWPKDGPIDLAVHDLPHASSTIEWWYQNCHVKSKEGRTFSLFASFFRLAIGRDEETGKFKYAHSITWSLTDVDNNAYYPDSVVDQVAPSEGLKMIERGDDESDKLLQDAIKEVFEKGNVPLPDRLLQKEAIIGETDLILAYDDNLFIKDEDGTYRLKLYNPASQVGCELTFKPQVEPVRHGDNGVVVGTGGEDMFYYFIPSCIVSGRIALPNEEPLDVEGTGWYDHEFGAANTSETIEVSIKHDIAWNWISLQLENGYRISGYDLFDNLNGGKSAGRWAIVVSPTGERFNVQDFSFVPGDTWTSTRTFTTYPVTWTFAIPSMDIEFKIEASHCAQEFITLISKPAFWEGRIHAKGRIGRENVIGTGYIERSGFNNVEKVEAFFKAVTKQTKKSIHHFLPLEPSDEQFARLVASAGNQHYLSGLDKAQFVANVIKPIRDMIDRGGKSWRSYGALVCIDAVGGNSDLYSDWLMLPELLHTGSLIIDDVQDRSEIRRGGPSCHILYGEPVAINAGNACYFLGQLLLLDERLSDSVKLKVYELYFEAMRAAHAGQAADISGPYDIVEEAVISGNGKNLEDRILATHRLKSAVPPSLLAKIGAMIGGGSNEQVEALGNFYEALGLAFQIVDDVLNLRGFKNNLKDRGEDITAGKITIPVAKAMSLLNADLRRYLVDTVQSKPTDQTIIADVIELLEDCGAINASQEEAESLVEAAWEKLDQVIPDSFVKLRLRVFSWVCPAKALLTSLAVYMTDFLGLILPINLLSGDSFREALNSCWDPQKGIGAVRTRHEAK